MRARVKHAIRTCGLCGHIWRDRPRRWTRGKERPHACPKCHRHHYG